MENRDLRLVVITGLSGAGRTQAMQSLEDQGFFCVDNLPPAFIVKFAELCAESRGKISRAAIVCDLRGGEFFNSLSEALVNLEAEGFQYEILFLEASDETLIYRYKESRRRHPMSPNGRILDGIQAERMQLEELRGKASAVINTTALTSQQLRRQVVELFTKDNGPENLRISLVSFGFKYGLPLDADLVMDVRFLPNPHYVPELSPLTGEDPAVQEYVLSKEVTQEFLRRHFSLLEFILPYYHQEGKTNLVIGVGCTGGQHRSVTIVEEIGKFLDQKGFTYSIKHRDIPKNLKGGERK